MAAGFEGLPEDVVLKIMRHMPKYAQAWYRGLAKSFAKHLADGDTMVIDAKQPDLPLWLLQQYFADIDTDNAHSGVSKDGNKRQAQLLSARAAAGDLTGVQWLRSQKCAWSSHACIAAAEGGHLNVLIWLLSQRPACPMDAGLCAIAAAASGQLAVLQFLRTELFLRPFDLEACAEAAAAAGRQAVLDWLTAQDDRLAATVVDADQESAAAARRVVQQIISFARERSPAAVMVRA